MMRSLFSGVSGLKNHQTRMDVIGNNIANVNTTGFKASRTQFQEVLSQTLQASTSSGANRGGTNPIQIGLGMGVASIDTIFTDGSFQSTGIATDLAIEGQGFFVLSDGTGVSKVFTRAGNFDFDEQGYFIVPGTGLFVQGWTADLDGNLIASGDTGPIRIPVGASMKPKTTENMTFGNNLNATTTLGESITETLKVYDSLGTAHQVNATFTRIGINEWIYAIDVPSAAAGTLQNRLGKLTFNENGLLKNVSTIVPSTATAPKYSLTPNDTAGSTTTSTISVVDNNGNLNVFYLNMTKDLVNSEWTYQITDISGTPVKAGLISYDTATGTYKEGATDITSLVFNASGEPVTIDLVAPGTTAKFEQNRPLYSLTLNDTNNAVYSTSITVVDDSGNPRVFNMQFTTNATGDGWEYEIKESGVINPSTVKRGSISYDGTAYTYKDATGTVESALTFAVPGRNGAITIDVTPTPSANGNFAQSNLYAESSLAAVSFATESGSDPVTISLDMNDITQFGSSTTVKITGQDGYAAGELESKSIDANGIIIGRYSNNQTRILGQVAIATFNNPGGLTKVGDSLFVQSASSGEAQIGIAGSGGRGTLNPGSLEMSNVDLAEEFSNMIITQRGFQANSKIITTTDEMLQELANLKR